MPSSQLRELKDERVGIITEVFRPLLVKVLDVRDITEHLKSHFDKDDPMFNELVESCQTSAPRAGLTGRLLDILEEKPDQQGLFKAFLDALKHTGHDTLMGTIEGTCEFDTKRRGHYRHLLRVFAERLEVVSPATLLPHLSQHLTTRDREAIMAKIQNEGELSGTTELLLRLDRKCDKWFDSLVEGLEADPGSQELGREMREMKQYITGSSRESDEDFSADEIASGVDTYHIDNKTNELCDDAELDDGVVEHKSTLKEIQCIVSGRSLEDPYFRKVSAVMEGIEKRILTSDEGKRLESEDGAFSKNRSRRGQQAYEQVVINLEKRIKQHVEQGDRMRELVACVSFLRGYNDSLFINRDIQTLDAIAYMERYVSEEEKTKASGRMDLILIKQFREMLPSLRTIAGMASSRNPVLGKLKQKLMREYRRKADSRGIVFTRTRVSAKALAGWLNEDPQLVPLQLNAHCLIDHENTRMSSSAQDVLLQKFRDGGHKIIIATSLAEEGLDIEACNLVFRYNYVTSDIGHMQSKGGKRAFSGKVYVIVNANLLPQERELRNITKVASKEDTESSPV